MAGVKRPAAAAADLFAPIGNEPLAESLGGMGGPGPAPAPAPPASPNPDIAGVGLRELLGGLAECATKQAVDAWARQTDVFHPNLTAQDRIAWTAAVKARRAAMPNARKDQR